MISFGKMMTVDDILSLSREARAAAHVARKFRPRVFMVEDGLHSEKPKRKLWFSFAVSLICSIFVRIFRQNVFIT